MRLLYPSVSYKILGAAISLSLMNTGCSTETKQTAQTRAIPVKLQTLTSSTLIDSSQYVGYLEAQQRVNLAPRIEGRIMEIFVQEGDQVEKGQAVAELEPTKEQEEVNSAVGNLNVARANLNTAAAQLRESQAQRDASENAVAQRKADLSAAKANLKNQEAELSSKEADLSSAIAELDLAKVNYERAAFLVKEGVTPQQDLDNNTRDLKSAEANVESRRKVRDAAKASRDQAAANVEAAQESLNIAIKNLKAAEERVEASTSQVNSQQAAIASAQGQLGVVSEELYYNIVKAPINGLVGDFNQKKVGDYIRTGETLTTITDNEIFLLNINIPIEYYNRLRIGLPVEIINSDGTSGTRGEVTFIAPLVNQSAQALLTKVSFRNDGRLRNNQYVRVRVIWNEKPGVLIPTTAVTSLGSQNFVFVAQTGGDKQGTSGLLAKQIPVEVGTIQGQAYQVISGVKPGERIAVSRILDLKNNTPIVEETAKSEEVKQ